MTLFVYGGLVFAFLTLVNVLNNKWAPRLYLGICLAGTAILLASARWVGLSWGQLGLGAGSFIPGLIWAGAIFALVPLGYLLAAWFPLTRSAFADQRHEGKSVWHVMYHAFVRIPFGTALLEEVAFRGVLLAIGVSLWGFWPGVIASSLTFGLWHILPSWDFHEVNAGAAAVLGDGRGARLKSVGGTVLGTALAGLGFCALRDWSGSLLAPFAMHAALNGFGILASWSVGRRL